MFQFEAVFLILKSSLSDYSIVALIAWGLVFPIRFTIYLFVYNHTARSDIWLMIGCMCDGSLTRFWRWKMISPSERHHSYQNNVSISSLICRFIHIFTLYGIFVSSHKGHFFIESFFFCIMKSLLYCLYYRTSDSKYDFLLENLFISIIGR